MEIRRNLLRLLALLFAFALVAAACGSSDDDDSSSGSSESATATADDHGDDDDHDHDEETGGGLSQDAVENAVSGDDDAEEEVDELVSYESDVSIYDMSKKELEEYGRAVGLELDRRHSRTKLITELQDYLANS